MLVNTYHFYKMDTDNLLIRAACHDNIYHMKDQYTQDRNEPISENTVITINSTGHVISQWGSDFFFLPHMITIDAENNVWITDVAMHQVFKFGPYGGPDKKPLIELGTKVCNILLYIIYL